ncbi:MAG: hypothetical protein KAH12_00285 [Anaerolineales bacterium]|nr:hypothetical protein [Anaerolineales bacterium]
MKIVAISDTHGLRWSFNIPNGDVLIHAGDLINRGILDEVKDFNKFLGTLPHPHKVIITDYHDFCIEDYFDEDYYSLIIGTNPEGPTGVNDHVIRSGAGNSRPEFIRSANQHHYQHNYRINYLSFRSAQDAQ